MGLPALYTLASQYRELEALIGSDEPLDDATLEAIGNTLEGLEGEIEVKATNVSAFALNLEAYAKVAKDAAKALSERAKRIERRAEALKAYVLTHMQACGLTKIEGPEFTVAVRKNPPSVEISGSADLGDEWLVFPPAPPPSPDKRKIAEALKAGQQIAGCALSSSVRLDIRA